MQDRKATKTTIAHYTLATTMMLLFILVSLVLAGGPPNMGVPTPPQVNHPPAPAITCLFEEVYRRFYSKVEIAVARHLKRPIGDPDVNGIVADTFAAFATQLGPGYFQNLRFLKENEDRIDITADNVCLAYLRQITRGFICEWSAKQTRDRTISLDTALLDDDAAKSIAVWPDQESDWYKAAELVRALRERMDPDKLELLLLHANGNTYKQIAEKTGRSEGSIRMAIFYAREEARSKLEKLNE